MRRKYHNKKIRLGDIIFDSKKEYKRYLELKALEDAGIIKGLERQVKYRLIPAQYAYSGDIYTRGIHKGELKKDKLLERECSYIADFKYYISDTGEMIVEDTKGFRTPEYIIKRKLMLHVFGIQIKEI